MTPPKELETPDSVVEDDPYVARTPAPSRLGQENDGAHRQLATHWNTILKKTARYNA